MLTQFNAPTLRLALNNATPYPDEIWVTLDGRRLRVGEMDEAHVRNALRMMIRKRREARAELFTIKRREMYRAALRALIEKEAEECIGEERKWGA